MKNNGTDNMVRARMGMPFHCYLCNKTHNIRKNRKIIDRCTCSLYEIVGIYIYTHTNSKPIDMVFTEKKRYMTAFTKIRLEFQGTIKSLFDKVNPTPETLADPMLRTKIKEADRAVRRYERKYNKLKDKVLIEFVSEHGKTSKIERRT